MPLYSFEGKSPRVHPTAFVAPTACLIGDVTVEENASVWYGAVLRADFNPIVIRRGANVQDNAVLHVTPAGGVEVGPGATVGHLCLVHAATSARRPWSATAPPCSTARASASRAMVGAGSLVTPGTEIPDGHARAGRAVQGARPARGHGGRALGRRGHQALPGHRPASRQRHRAGRAPPA